MVCRTLAFHLMFLLVISSIDAQANAETTNWDQPTWGVSIADVPEEPLDVPKFRWPTRSGALVASVAEGGPADNAGVTAGDVVIMAAGEKVVSAADLRDTIGKAGLEEVAIVVHKMNVDGERVRWRRKGLKLTPITYRQFVALETVRKYDEATGTTIVQHRGTTAFVDDQSGVDAQILSTKDDVTLRLRIKYVDDSELLSIKSYTFLVDGERYEVAPPPFGVKSDLSLKKRWEWYNAAAELPGENSEVVKLVRALAKAKDAKVVFHGSRYRGEHEITVAERERIAMVLALVDMVLDDTSAISEAEDTYETP